MKRSALVAALLALTLTACGEKTAETAAPAPAADAMKPADAMAPASAPAAAMAPASAPAADAMKK
ncbi:MAG TPA: hypothetical protein VFF41_08170 [Gallionella sp.]|nr:hypothetical protein [Gallionella sp.]